MMTPIGPWLPDIAASNPDVSANVANVILKRDSVGIAYGPCPSLAVAPGAMALPAAPAGGLAVTADSGGKKLFMGTASALYEMDNAFQWTEIATGYSVPAGHKWSMLQFGSNLLLTNTTDGLLAYNVDSPAGVNAVSGAPSFRTIFSAFDCVFGLRADGESRLMVNSAPNSASEWQKEGAGYQPLPDGEELMNGAQLTPDFAVVLQRNAINLLTRTADRRIYTRKRMLDGVGAVSPESFVAARGVGYFMDTDGPYRVTPEGAQPLGRDKMAATFVDEMVGAIDAVEAAYDPGTQRILWRYPLAGTDGATIFRRLLSYDIRQDQFVPIEETTTAILTTASPGYTADNADSLGTVDSVDMSVDSRFWLGGEEGLFGLDADYLPGFFDGDNLAATMDTATAFNSRSELLSWLTPITDASGASVAAGVAERLADDITWKAAAAMNSSGDCEARARGRVWRSRVTIPAGATWSYVRGVKFNEPARGGSR